MTIKQQQFFQKKEKEFAKTIIENIKEGTAPFIKPWKAGELQLPYNAVNKNLYHGKNIIRLLSDDKIDPRFITFNQAKSLGFTVKKGAKSKSISFFKPISAAEFEKWEKQGSDPNKKPFPTFKYYNVFSASDIIGIEELPTAEFTFNTHEVAEQIINKCETPIFHDSRDRAYFSVTNDEIHLPPKANFRTAEDYYSVVLHEIAHSTGHESKLNRTFSSLRGDETYAFEELIAQISSYMISCYLALPHNPQHSFNYVETWLQILKNDDSKINTAVKAANEVINYLLTPELKDKAIKLNAEPRI